MSQQGQQEVIGEEVVVQEKGSKGLDHNVQGALDVVRTRSKGAE